MRRNDRQVTEWSEILDMISRSEIIRLAMVDHGRPYIVPLHFGYKAEGEELTFYFHSANQGRKLDIMKENPLVCFEMDSNMGLRRGGDIACRWGTYYESVIGEGEITFLEGEERIAALDVLMAHYGFEGKAEYEEKFLNMICVYQLRVTSITAKRNPPKEMA